MFLFFIIKWEGMYLCYIYCSKSKLLKTISWQVPWTPPPHCSYNLIQPFNLNSYWIISSKEIKFFLQPWAFLPHLSPCQHPEWVQLQNLIWNPPLWSKTLIMTTQSVPWKSPLTLKENGYVYIHICMDIYMNGYVSVQFNWITLLYTWNQLKIVNQLLIYFNIK